MTAAASLSWFDRALLQFAPGVVRRRLRDRLAADLMMRYYDAASAGRRTEGWRRVSGDGNAATARGRPMRDTARDLVRNNAWAKSAVTTVTDHVIGWGITPKLPPGPFGVAWSRWANTTACDSEGRRTLNGLAKLALGTWFVAGECLIRRRIRRLEDNLPIPLQLQVLEPDFLDSSRDTVLPTGGEIIQGVEYDPIGNPAAYWLFRSHPGSTQPGIRGAVAGQSVRIPASEIIHLADPDRPGQARDVSKFAPVLLRMHDLDDYEDAALMKQKIAACLSVILTDSTGAGVPLGSGDDTNVPGLDTIGPGLITRFAAGDTATVVNPPAVNEHGPYTKTVLQGIAAGLGISYESLVGDFSQVNFSSARLARLREWDRIHHWRWDMLVPQFYGPHAQGRSIWDWTVQIGAIVGLSVPSGFMPEWTAPPMPMIEPDKEGLAYQRNIRTGIQTLSDALRELGYDPAAVLAEMAADWRQVDRLGLILDSDPRNTNQNGQLQGAAAAAMAPLTVTPPAPRPAPTETATAATLARVERMLETVLVSTRNGHAPAVSVPVTIADGAIRGGDVHVAAPPMQPPPPAPAVHVDARTTMEPGTITVPVDARTIIGEGAIHTEVAPAAITVDARTTVEPITVPVDARTTIAEAAIQTTVSPAPVTVDARTTIEPAAITVPPLPETRITVLRPPSEEPIRRSRRKARPSPLASDGTE